MRHNYDIILVLQEKLLLEMTKASKEGVLQSLSTKGIRSKRCRTSPVKNNDVIVPPGSDDEDAKVDLLCRRKLFLKKARKVAIVRRTNWRMLLDSLHRPGYSLLKVKELKRVESRVFQF